MIVKKGTIQYNSSKGVFWQKSYFENEEGKIFVTAIICASEEFLSGKLRKRLENIMNINVNDIDIQKWFEDRITTIAVTEKVSQDKTLCNGIIDLYPQTEAMLDAAKSFLNNRN